MPTTPIPFRIYGSEMSPYSVKVRSYFRYKGLPHRWLIRNASNQAEYQRHAKIPMIPLVVTPDEQGIQDSTPIIDRIEALYPQPSVHPGDAVASFVSMLLEEFGDEWGNKWMFHYRWARDVDQLSAAGRIARQMNPRASHDRARGSDRPDPCAHGGSGLVRRLQRDDRAADRGLVRAGHRSARCASRGTCVSVRRPAGVRRLRSVGAVVLCVDRPDRRRIDRRPRAAPARMDSADVVATSRR